MIPRVINWCVCKQLQILLRAALNLIHISTRRSAWWHPVPCGTLYLLMYLTMNGYEARLDQALSALLGENVYEEGMKLLEKGVFQ